MKCPECEGKGFHVALACPGARIVHLPCRVCDNGEITQDDLDRIKAGRDKREDRIRRDMSLREEAKRIGISPVELSVIERGLKPR